jgi:hypothetical protein
MTQVSSAYLCGNCGSPAVDVPVLAGANYKCRTCEWEGDDPILIPFGNPFGGSEETFRAFTYELLTEFAKVSALPIGRVIVKWGFVPRDKAGKPNTAVLAAYIKAMAEGMVTALLRQCEAMETSNAGHG